LIILRPLPWDKGSHFPIRSSVFKNALLFWFCPTLDFSPVLEWNRDSLNSEIGGALPIDRELIQIIRVLEVGQVGYIESGESDGLLKISEE
jgi:hypothetical protein